MSKEIIQMARYIGAKKAIVTHDAYDEWAKKSQKPLAQILSSFRKPQP